MKKGTLRERLATAIAERDRYQAAAWEAKAEAASARASSSIALQTYGRHLSTCPWSKIYGPDERCTCGLQIAIAELGSRLQGGGKLSCCNHETIFHVRSASGRVFCVGGNCACSVDPKPELHCLRTIEDPPAPAKPEPPNWDDPLIEGAFEGPEDDVDPALERQPSSDEAES